MVKKEFQVNLVREYNEKSDTELLDALSDFGVNKVQTAQALLDLRLKKSIQYLTKVVKRNNKEMNAYNKSLTKLTKLILFFTVVMTVTTIINVILLFK